MLRCDLPPHLYLAHSLKGQAMPRCNHAPRAVLCPAPAFVVGLCAVLIAMIATSALVLAQESIGFADPEDIQPLLDYRLPDWGYRNWELSGSLEASGDDDNPLDRQQYLSPRLRYGRYHESERSVRRIAGELSGGFNRLEGSSQDVLQDMDGRFLLSGRTDRYFRSPWFYSLNAMINADYDESRLDDMRSVDRSFSHFLSIGLGRGHQRNVVPLLRAKRISERLRALGRDPLSDREVERLAEVIAQRGGYSVVFDRPDRRFWGPVFEILEAGRPFTAYEVLYLTDVMLEDIGQRIEGGRIELSTSWWSETFSENSSNNRVNLDYSWYHNYGLDYQLGLYLRGLWSWDQNPGRDARFGSLSLGLEHLWVVADRILWSNLLNSLLQYRGYADGSKLSKELSAHFTSRFIFYVEDRWSIVPELSTRENWYDSAGRSNWNRWSWNLRVSMNYRFGSGLF
jgi:hypothetical protein